MYLVFLLYALFASVFTISKTGLEIAQPYFFVGSRMTIAGLLLLSYLFLFHRSQFSFNKTQLFRLFCLSLFNIYLTNTFEFWGLQYLTSSKTCFIYSLSPFMSALLCQMILKESLSAKKWIGMGIGFLGILPILLSMSTAEERAGQFLIFSWAELAVMGAALCSCYGWILLKQSISQDGLTPLMANGVSMLAGGVMALGHSYATENWSPVPVTDLTTFIVCAGLLIIISNFICYNMYGWLLNKFSATFISCAGLSTPLFTAFFGWLFLGEQISWIFFASLAILSLGLLLFYQEEFKTVEATP